MRDFKFVPGYYEWHLKQKGTNKLLHVMNDPMEDMYNINPDTNEEEPISHEELYQFCFDELVNADNSYNENEEYNGLKLNELERLDEEEMSRAAQVMCQALKERYID